MAGRPVFADTSFFFALAARQDVSHAEAVRALRLLVGQRQTIVTTDYVIDETLTLTKVRAGAPAALALLDRIERSPSVAVEPILPARFDGAKAFFRRHADHGYSFTDCSSFVIMRELRMSRALTTDRHFREAGFEVLLPIR